MTSAGNVGEKSVQIVVGKEIGRQRRIKCFWTSRNSLGISGARIGTGRTGPHVSSFLALFF